MMSSGGSGYAQAGAGTLGDILQGIGDIQERNQQRKYADEVRAREVARYDDYKTLQGDAYLAGKFRKQTMFPATKDAWNAMYVDPTKRYAALTDRAATASSDFQNVVDKARSNSLLNNALAAKTSGLVSDIFTGGYGNRMRSNIQPVMAARSELGRVGGKQAALESMAKTLGQMEQQGIRDSYSANRMRFDANYGGAANEAMGTAQANLDNARMLADVNSNEIAQQYASLTLPQQMALQQYQLDKQLVMDPYATMSTMDSAAMQQMINEIQLRNSLIPAPNAVYTPPGEIPYVPSEAGVIFGSIGSSISNRWGGGGGGQQSQVPQMQSPQVQQPVYYGGGSQQAYYGGGSPYATYGTTTSPTVYGNYGGYTPGSGYTLTGTSPQQMY